MFRFTIRDLFWLVLICAFAAGWWTERDKRGKSDQRYLNARKTIEQTGKLLQTEINEKNGLIVGLRGRYEICPVCGDPMRIADRLSQVRTDDGTFYWRRTGSCDTCKGQFAYTLMPDDAPGFGTWISTNPSKPPISN